MRKKLARKAILVKSGRGVFVKYFLTISESEGDSGFWRCHVPERNIGVRKYKVEYFMPRCILWEVIGFIIKQLLTDDF